MEDSTLLTLKCVEVDFISEAAQLLAKGDVKRAVESLNKAVYIMDLRLGLASPQEEGE